MSSLSLHWWIAKELFRDCFYGVFKEHGCKLAALHFTAVVNIFPGPHPPRDLNNIICHDPLNKSSNRVYAPEKLWSSSRDRAIRLKRLRQTAAILSSRGHVDILCWPHALYPRFCLISTYHTIREAGNQRRNVLFAVDLDPAFRLFAVDVDGQNLPLHLLTREMRGCFLRYIGPVDQLARTISKSPPDSNQPTDGQSRTPSANVDHFDFQALPSELRHHIYDSIIDQGRFHQYKPDEQGVIHPTKFSIDPLRSAINIVYTCKEIRNEFLPRLRLAADRERRYDIPFGGSESQDRPQADLRARASCMVHGKSVAVFIENLDVEAYLHRHYTLAELIFETIGHALAKAQDADWVWVGLAFPLEPDHAGRADLKDQCRTLDSGIRTAMARYSEMLPHVEVHVDPMVVTVSDSPMGKGPGYAFSARLEDPGRICGIRREDDERYPLLDTPHHATTMQAAVRYLQDEFLWTQSGPCEYSEVEGEALEAVLPRRKIMSIDLQKALTAI